MLLLTLVWTLEEMAIILDSEDANVAGTNGIYSLSSVDEAASRF